MGKSMIITWAYTLHFLLGTIILQAVLTGPLHQPAREKDWRKLWGPILKGVWDLPPRLEGFQGWNIGSWIVE